MSATSAVASFGSPAKLSGRGQEALHRPPLLKCSLFECQYAPSSPDGLINLGVAENSLVTDWLIEYFARRPFVLQYSDFTYGTALGGSLRLFGALKSLFTNHFNAFAPVEREHIIAGSGCGSVIDLLVSCIADPGDGILVSRPHYNGFIASFGCRNQVQAVGVTLPAGREAEMGEEGVAAYEAALEESEAAGCKIKAVMVCNPHNPLGFCYTREALEGYMRFCEKHNLHLIVDEIYALSTFATPATPDAQPFVSILAIDPAAAGCHPSRVHAVYGASKDWGANGLRIGALVSQANPDLHVAMESSCLLMKISSAADHLWSGLLLDPVGLPEYLALNRSHLSSSYELATAFLNAHKIAFRPSNAGHFIWIDLRKYLPTADSAGAALAPGMAQEDELAARFTANRVNVARGAAYSHPEPGYFRLTFTLRRDFFLLGLARIEKTLGLEEGRAAGLVAAAAGLRLEEPAKVVETGQPVEEVAA